MSQEVRKIQSFTDLAAWREAHALVIQIYTITKSFPNDELFGLTNQIRRATPVVIASAAKQSRETGLLRSFRSSQ